MSPLEQAAPEQPEVKSYDEQMQDDVRAAFSEVSGKGTEQPAPDKPITTEQPAETRTIEQRARDEQGRFAKTDTKPAKEVVQDTTGRDLGRPDANRPAPDKPQPALTPEQSAQAPKLNPPNDWEPKAKAQWDRLPEVVRNAISRSTTVDPSYSELRPFLDRAKQSGQSLASALNAYVGMEDLIRRDPGQGLMNVAQNLGLTQYQAGQLFAGLAQRLGVMPQGGGQQELPAPNSHDVQQEPDAYRALAPVLHPIQQEMHQLKAYIERQEQALQAQRMSSSMSAIEKFRSSSDARYFENVEKDIAHRLDTGIVPRTGDMLTDLKRAYESACWDNPEIRQILIAEQAEKDRVTAETAARQAADKARNASRSITGSPSPGASAPVRPRDQKLSYDEDLMQDVQAAIRSVSARA